MTPIILILSLIGPIDRERFLAAVAEYETGNNPHAVGKAHETTKWQISPVAWRDLRRNYAVITNAPMQLLALKESRMRSAKVPITVTTLSLAWNRGVEGARKRRWKPTAYSNRVESLYHLARPDARRVTPSTAASPSAIAQAVPSISKP